LTEESPKDELDKRIADAKAAHQRGISDAEGRAEGRGWAIGIEFVGAVLVSAFIGWMIDRFAGTAPWGLIIMLILGFAAGVRSALKASGQFDADPDNDEKD